jgi:DNA (cytosine-5)-methyltransferase 1
VTYRAIDCLGFAGGFTLGTVQAGFELIGKRELPGGFGVPNCEANRHLLGDGWQAQVGEWETWEPRVVDLVFGNPPCSGFSVMSNKQFRGVNSKINDCMWAFTNFAARCAPPVAVFESVRSAYTQGLPLMRALRASLEERTGIKYDLYHVYHNAVELGGAAQRPRYFWVASAIPFGVDFPRVRRPRLSEVIGDLLGLGSSWEPQPYRRPATWWSDRVRTSTGVVDGHTSAQTPAVARALDLLRGNGGWPEGEHLGEAARRHYEQHGKLPPSWQRVERKVVERNFSLGYTTLTRWRWNDPGRVITGGALQLVLHPVEDRVITHREAARIMGFPDDWIIKPLRRVSGVGMTWGKGITTQCGRWIATQVRRALDGDPGSYRGVSIGDREFFVQDPSLKKVAPKVLVD